MENEQVVKPDQVTTDPDSGVVNPPKMEAPDPGSAAPEPPAFQAGDKTDPNLLLKSLQEERDKRRELEGQINDLESKLSTLSDDEVFSDEGKILKKEIGSLRSELTEIRGELSKEKIISSTPILKEKWSEFEEFRALPENKGMNLRTAAKAFLIENGLLEPSRKGLEKTTGGPRMPLTSGMTAEDVKTLRETNFRKYQEMLMKGQIKIE